MLSISRISLLFFVGIFSLVSYSERRAHADVDEEKMQQQKIDEIAIKACEAALTKGQSAIAQEWRHPTNTRLKPENSRAKYVVLSLLQNDFVAGEFVKQMLNDLPPNTQALIIEMDINAKDPMAGAQFRFADAFRSKRAMSIPISLTEGQYPSNWTRDFVPNVVFNQDGTVSHLALFHYGDKSINVNAGAEKTAAAIAKHLGVRLVKSPLTLEGGNLERDNNGNIFITEKVLTANPKLTRIEVENALKQMLNIDGNIHWIPMMPREPTGPSI